MNETSPVTVPVLKRQRAPRVVDLSDILPGVDVIDPYAIGKGAYSSVYHCRGSTGDLAVKIQVFTTTDKSDAVLRELEFMRCIGRTCLCASAYGLKQEGNVYTVAMAYPKADTTLHLLPEWYRPTSPEDKWYKHKWSAARQLFEALSFVHSKKFVHYDIKPHNVLVNSTCIDGEQFLTFIIADFGLSRPAEEEVDSDEVVSLPYRNPEMLCGRVIHPYWADVYAMCETLFGFTNGFDYLGGETPSEILSNLFIRQGRTVPDQFVKFCTFLRGGFNYHKATAKQMCGRLKRMKEHSARNPCVTLEQPHAKPPHKAKGATFKQQFLTATQGL